MRFRRAAPVWVVVSLVFSGAGALAQPATFPVFTVNTATAGIQESPSVAMDPAGNFVVHWDGFTGAPQFTSDVWGRGFDDVGTEQFGEFQANTFTTSHQYDSDVAKDDAGNFVVVWTSRSQDGSNTGIVGRLYNSAGTALTGEFLVNTTTANYQTYPSVARNASGEFVVVWMSRGPGGIADENVFARRYNAAGVAQDPTEFQVNTETAGYQQNPDVAIDDAGNFLVVWESPGPGDVGGSVDIKGRLFGANPKPEFVVNASTSDSQTNPRVAASPFGFVVVWASNHDTSSSGSEVYGQRFDSSGTGLGGEFIVTRGVVSGLPGTVPGGDLPDVAIVDDAGSFVVVFKNGLGGTNGTGGIFGQAFFPSGTRTGTQIVLGSTIVQSQALNHPRVAGNRRGNVVITWEGNDNPLAPPNQFSPGVLASRAEFRAAGGLTVDQPPAGPIQVRATTAAANNRVLEPGETVSVEPTWTNTLNGTQVLAGTASALTGPAGGTYTLNDTTADYGSVAEGDTANCQTATGDCYEMTVSGSPRPATHWDASFVETLGIGLTKIWSLHVGESFTDVPTSQLFYRAIESVLHAGITTGCTAATYCPGDQVTRSQMSLFLARGVAGGGFAIPASGSVANAYSCGAGGISLFTDVLPTDIFCRSVHYLAAQNVTSGCSATQYCPTPNVSRLEMSAFVARAVVAPGGGAAVPLTYGPDPVTNLSYSCDPASPNIHFTDVPASNGFCKHAHFLWAKGIISGCGATTYCPNDPVTRDAMARFLTNGFGVRLYGP